MKRILFLALCAALLGGCASERGIIKLDGGTWTPVRAQTEPEPVFGPLPEYRPARP